MPRDFFGGTLINSNTGTVRNPMIYSAILGGADSGAVKPIVIDTGMKGDFSPSGKGYDNVEHPKSILSKIGVTPADIETVILTHLHFDHAGNLDQFSNATFYVQGNTWNLIETYRRLRALLNDDVNRIVPGHDPELFERHPSWMAGHNPVAEIHLAKGAISRRPTS